jgi:hypothetical protein
MAQQWLRVFVLLLLQVSPLMANAQREHELEFERIAAGKSPDLSAAESFLVARSHGALNRIWAHVKSPSVQIPKVDFSSSLVIAVFSGLRPLCPTYRITRILEGDERILVEVTKSVTEGSDCTCVAEVANQYDIVRIAAVHKRIEHTLKTEHHGCKA